MRLFGKRTIATFLSILFGFIFGYKAFYFINENAVERFDNISPGEFITPTLFCVGLGVFAGVVGIIRNRQHKVEISVIQVVPYLFATIGFLYGHVALNGFANLSDSSLVSVLLISWLFMIGLIKNVILVIHNIRLD